MKSNTKTAISPTRAENYPQWYQQIIKAADLAETSPVRGCMTIKPWGYALWENFQSILNEKIKACGVKNAYFPLLIPLSFMQKEAEHIEGFAKECAVVTHHRLATDADGKLVPAGPLEEPYIIRPTSETIIGEAFSRWIQSYRDLPLRINQWANVMRWEMRTRLFLRTSEFLWQEGHTAHASADEAMQEALTMLGVYADICENYLAMPVIQGEKTASERFPGAVNTYCIEAMMQDKKALQAGTSHFLGQHFAKSFAIKFLNHTGNEAFVWTTSWGTSTRLVGSLIMVHSDDDGLVLPPKIAPLQIVILPIIHKPEDQTRILNYCQNLQDELKQLAYHDQKIQVEIDARDLAGGEKAWSWVKKGVPVRLEIGSKEQATNSVYIGRRDRAYRDKQSLARNEFIATVQQQLDDIQANLLQRARNFQQQNTQTVHSKTEFYDYFKTKGGFALAHFSEDATIEKQLKEDLSVTVRCVPFNNQSKGNCIFTGKEGANLMVFATAY